MKIKTLFQAKKATNLSGNITTNGAVTVINKGSATVDGQIIQPASIVTNTINANELTTNNIQNNGNISTNSLSSNTISANTISSSSLSTGDLVANNIFSTGNLTLQGDLTVEGDANFSTIKSTNIDNADTITTKNLTVTGTAHFFELIIDQIKAAGGSILATPADGFTIDDITFNGIFYTSYGGTTYHFENCPFLWFKSTDGDNLRNDKGRKNTWEIWDQAICANFNAAFDGNYSVGVNNNLWWCMVGNTNNTHMSYSYADFMTYNSYSYAYTWDPTTSSYTYQWVNAEPKSNIGQPVLHNIYDRTRNNGELLETAYCHYIALLPYNPDNDSRPTQEENYSSLTWDVAPQDYYKQIGNDVAMLGHNWRDRRTNSDATNRRSAIYLSCYSNDLDKDLKPPFWAHYSNIDDFSLDGKRLTKFDAAGGEVIGSFKVQSGNNQVNLDQYIKSLQDTNPMKLYAHNIQDQDLTLIAMQTNDSNKITNLNNFPSVIAIKVSNNNTDINLVTDINLNSLTLNLFGNDPTYGRNIDLKGWISNPTTDNYNGIYVTKVEIPYPQTAPQIMFISFDYRQVQGGQTINNTSITFSGQYTIGSDTYDFSYNIPVIGISNAKGDDAELYRLVKKYESAVVDENGDLTVDLQYKIQHIIGTTVTYPQPTNTQTLRIRVYGGTGNVIQEPAPLTSSNWKSGGYWEWPWTQEDWYEQELKDRAMYVTVDLMDGTQVIDSVLVNVELSNTSLFEVNDKLMRSIQANTTAIDDETNARQTQYSSIIQTVTGISTTVSNQQSQINALKSYTYTNISEIKQEATGISLSVSTLQSDLDNLEGGIRRTGIDIEDGKINLNAENTNINGNLNIYNPNEGLVIYNENEPKIFLNNGSIGTFSEFDKGGTVAYPLSFVLYETPLSNTFTVNYCEDFLGHQLSIGTRKANTDITISDIFVTCNESEYPLASVISSATYRVKLNNVNIASGTPQYISDNGKIVQIKIPKIVYHNTVEEEKQLEVSITWTVTKTGNITTYLRGTCNAYINIMQTIGTDGAIFQSGIDKRAVFATDSIDFRNLGNEIRITESAILRTQSNTLNPGSTSGRMGDISSTLPYRIVGTNYTVGPYDCIIKAVASGITITLGSVGNNNIPQGKQIIILNGSTGRINISAGGQIIVDNGSEVETQYLDKFKTLTYVKMGEWWTISHL